jgi:Flp pilus assembly protein protease CpaA
MTDTPIEPGLPPSLRLLKGLVIVLMITMIVGVITVVGLLVTRMPNVNAMAPALPAQLQMPAGAKATAVTMGAGWIGVVTTDNRILIFTPQGALQQEIAVTPAP